MAARQSPVKLGNALFIKFIFFTKLSPNFEIQVNGGKVPPKAGNVETRNGIIAIILLAGENP
jgi:hypothetical protein